MNKLLVINFPTDNTYSMIPIVNSFQYTLWLLSFKFSQIKLYTERTLDDRNDILYIVGSVNKKEFPNYRMGDVMTNIPETISKSNVLPHIPNRPLTYDNPSIDLLAFMMTDGSRWQIDAYFLATIKKVKGGQLELQNVKGMSYFDRFVLLKYALNELTFDSKADLARKLNKSRMYLSKFIWDNYKPSQQQALSTSPRIEVCSTEAIDLIRNNMRG